MPKIQRIKSYINYWLDAVNEHSLQGPFIYDLYCKVFKDKTGYSEFETFAQIRKRFLQSMHSVTVNDLGAGSSFDKNKERKVREIAKYGITDQKHCELLYRLIKYLQPKNILELGTSLGITTLYLAANEDSHIVTMEGDEKLANISMSVFEAHDKSNIRQICGNIDHLLPKYLLENGPLDFVFFDANHTYSATISYFSQCLTKAHSGTCFVFDDIH
ncbi:MAG: class I SAM-dependent methyltransferase, partial [Fulvivirga sp.]|nr:class I SAM-dependent methyltransferase [Fulvivirga sp.]